MYYVLSQTNPIPKSASDSVAYIQNEITPVIAWATDWGVQTGILLLGVALFYQVIITLVKPDK